MAEGQAQTTVTLGKEVAPAPNVHEAAAQAATPASQEAVLTSIAQRDSANAQTELAGVQRQLADEQLRLLRQQPQTVNPPTPVTVNTTVNVPLPALNPVQHSHHDPHWIEGAGCGILCLFAALAVAAIMAYGLWFGWLRPFRSTVNLAPIQVPAPIVRTFGTVDISAVATGDQGIDWFNPVVVGVYQLRQNSTGLFITDRGNTVLVDRAGTRLFR